MRHRRQIADVVECHDLQRRAMKVADRLENLPADPPKSVDTHFDCHENLLLEFSITPPSATRSEFDGGARMCYFVNSIADDGGLPTAVCHPAQSLNGPVRS